MKIFTEYLIFMCIVNVIYGDGIGILFNNIIILDNSTIMWNYFNNISSCFLPTTVEIEIQTTISIAVQSSATYTCFDGSYGVSCNISSDACDVANPCSNGAICHSNNTLSSGYYCQCPSGFSGDDCESDNRACAEDTCWNNGTCIEMNVTISNNNETSFTCQCIQGYEGTQCQLEIDMCKNITCENKGTCVSSYMTWSCECLDDSLYSGIYCQDKSSTLALKEALSKSFAIVAIVAISCLIGFVVIMDILKYVFKIDPVDRERYRLRMEKEKQEQMRFKKKKKPKKKKNIKKKKKKINKIDFVTRFSTV